MRRFRVCTVGLIMACGWGVVLPTTPARAWDSGLWLEPGFGLDLDQAQEGAPPEQPPPEEEPLAVPTGSFLLSDTPITPRNEILWPGFLVGMRGFEGFANPIGNPLYFETPFVNSEARFLYLWHNFPSASDVGGGDLSVFALQVRLALTERLGFIATKDGYSVMRASILPKGEGWNDLGFGLKYALIVDQPNQFVVTTGLRWVLSNGDRDILMGNTDELSPFISFAKGWDRLHLIGNITGRLPMDRHDGNYVLQWDLHLDYEIAPETLPGFYPVFEVHGLHYLSNGDRLPLAVGGLDYANIGSDDVAGSAVIWGGIGFRWKLTPNFSFGSTFEYPFHKIGTDIHGGRVTFDFIFRW